MLICCHLQYCTFDKQYAIYWSVRETSVWLGLKVIYCCHLLVYWLKVRCVRIFFLPQINIISVPLDPHWCKITNANNMHTYPPG